MSQTSFEDFYQVPNLKFDIFKLKKELENILKDKFFDTPGVTHFGAIPLNQIPNNPDSIKGHNIRGVYWTIPDETGKEVVRDVPIDESKYTEIVSDFKTGNNTGYSFKLPVAGKVMPGKVKGVNLYMLTNMLVVFSLKFDIYY